MKYFILLLTAFICFNVTAQPNYINISTTDVGPGVVHKKYLEPVQPWTLNVLEIDLTNPMITLESIIANDNIKGSGTVRTQLNSKIREGHTAIGAINGDFYSATPINSQVINGELIKQEDAGHYWATFNLDINNNPAITTNRFSSFVIAGGSKFEIKGINQARNSNWMVLYNSYYGTSTSTGAGVKELVISPTDEWLVNDTMKFVVESIGSGNAVLNKNKAVLSGEGSASDFITQNIHVGDTISLYMGLTNALPKLKQLIGGFPRIVKDGGNYAIDGYREEGGTSTFHTDIHPRSAIGFSADSTKLFFVTIDGRQASSRGMNLIELADFMIYIGVEHGMNLDGGGSTTLIVRDEVENSPSDGSERSVHNSLGVFTSASKGTLTSIQIEPDHFRLFKKDNLKFKTVGYDEYYNPISINNSKLVYSSNIAGSIINNSGDFTAGTTEDNSIVVVEYEGLKDTARIVVKGIGSIFISPKTAVADTFTAIEFKATTFDIDGVKQIISKNEIEWIVLDTSIGLIDSLGFFKGKANGETKVISKYGANSDTAEISVQIIEGTKLLHSFESLSGFGFSGENIDLVNSRIELVNSPITEGNGSFKVTYQFTGDPQKLNYLHFGTDMPLEAVPELLSFDLQTNGRKNHIRYYIQDYNDNEFMIAVKKWADKTTVLDPQPGVLKDATAIISGKVLIYPVSLKRIEIKLDSPRELGTVYRDSLFMDNLFVKYPGVTVGVEDEFLHPTNFTLFQNYPNPFNPRTVIKFQVPSSKLVKLHVYDILGREIKTLVNEYKSQGTYEVQFNADELASGVYFYRLISGSFAATKKMLLIR